MKSMLQDGKILVVGAPRSGTKFTASLLQHLGLDVGHESWGEDGMVSWTGVWTDGPWGSRDLEENPVVVHQVRHPLAVLRSWPTMRGESLRYIADKARLPYEPTPEWAARAYVILTELYDVSSAFRYRVEDLLVPEGMSNEMNTRKEMDSYGEWSTEDLLIPSLREKIEKYGYWQ